MNKKEFYYPSTDGKTQIHAIRWEPEGEPKAILQIIHGMVEFIDRYNDFAA
jgi:alpha-beta hydrolase superfamily lysophospholipase